MKKRYHKTKDGRTVKKGLYYYMNRAKKRGTSKPGKGTVTTNRKKMRKDYKSGGRASFAKGTHVTKDGRTVKKGLYCS